LTSNHSRLEEEFWNRNPELKSLSRKYFKERRLALILIFIGILGFIINVFIFKSFAIGLGIIFLSIIIFVILKLNGGQNFYKEFDQIKKEYLQHLLHSIENSDLQFIDNEVELKSEDIDEIGFLKPDAYPSFSPIINSLITGTYKKVNVKIGQLDFKSQKLNNAAIVDWKPSTLIIFDYKTDFVNERLSLYVKRSNTYGAIRNRELKTIQRLKKLVNLEGSEIKLSNRSLDLKYLTTTTNEIAAQKLLNERLINKLKNFNNWSYKIRGKTSMNNAKFLTIYNGKISILIFGQKFLQPRVEKIFEVYDNELRSILQFVDIFQQRQ